MIKPNLIRRPSDQEIEKVHRYAEAEWIRKHVAGEKNQHNLCHYAVIAFSALFDAHKVEIDVKKLAGELWGIMCTKEIQEADNIDAIAVTIRKVLEGNNDE